LDIDIHNGFADHIRRRNLDMDSHARHPKFCAVSLCCTLAVLISCDAARAQALHEGEAIQYDTAPVHDRVTDLQEKLDRGETSLTWESERGYLKSLLEQLEVPTSSQGLVFSKTSLQLRKISRKKPRAVYFNDDCYVGFCQFGEVLEVAAIDPQQGLVFYTLEQEQAEKPTLIRDKGNCLSCHATTRTQNVPGALVRSVFPDSGGTPLLGSGTYTTDDRSPFPQRWGGWYVSGTHGDMRHMGNVFAADKHDPEKIDTEHGANVTDLSPLVETKPYLTPHSDIVALMVLEHQTQMQNLLTFANFETRSATHYDCVMNEVLGRPKEFQSESTQRRIAAAGEKVVRGLLFSGEFALTSPVQGTSAFADEFSKRGVRDSQGRSLRDFDLQKRLFRYPCSFLIESEQFAALPEPMRKYVDRRLSEVLSGADQTPEFGHLSADDRQTILSILRETRPDRFTSIESASAENAE
jgi:hypothetical protein